MRHTVVSGVKIYRWKEALEETDAYQDGAVYAGC